MPVRSRIRQHFHPSQSTTLAYDVEKVIRKIESTPLMQSTKLGSEVVELIKKIKLEKMTKSRSLGQSKITDHEIITELNMTMLAHGAFNPKCIALILYVTQQILIKSEKEKQCIDLSNRVKEKAYRLKQAGRKLLETSLTTAFHASHFETLAGMRTLKIDLNNIDFTSAVYKEETDLATVNRAASN